MRRSFSVSGSAFKHLPLLFILKLTRMIDNTISMLCDTLNTFPDIHVRVQRKWLFKW